MNAKEKKKEELFEGLIDLEKKIIDTKHALSSHRCTGEERYEYLSQRTKLEQTARKNAKTLIKNLRRGNLSLCYPKLKDIEKQIGLINFAWLLKVIDKHPGLMSNENSINTITRLMTRNYFPYLHIKWHLSELSTTFLNDQAIEFFLIEHAEVFGHCEEIYKSNSLLKNKDFNTLLMEKIKNNEIAHSFYYSKDSVEDMENIISIDEDCDKKLLFSIGEKDLNDIRRNIENEDLINIFLLIAEGKKGYSKWLTSIIEKFNEHGNALLESKDDAFKRMKQIITLEVVDPEIFINYNNLLQTNNDWLNTKEVRTAMLNAKSVTHQNRLIRFLQEKEIRDELLREDSIYQDFLLNQIMSLDEGEYGKYTHLLDGIINILKSVTVEEQKRNLSNIFGNMEYIYFYNEEEQFTKTPTTFYRQFLSNVYSGGYISQCMYADNNTDNMPFYDEKIIEYAKENRLIDIAIRTMELGIDKDKNYNIEEEINWNRLLYEARYFTEEKYSKPKQKRKEAFNSSLSKI